ncbi:hypothetical protein [Pedobacter sp. R20-19]|uniref:hypothetical protein n=1 Tax=Pedobacter sp. R20-19 TaxID=1270196 RepID=UPI000493A749|nr:hypothetical protein [Pedobacter sp. R20-19]
MKIIGLIREYNNENNFSIAYKDYKKNILNDSKPMILEYLKHRGIAFATTMQIIKSLELNNDTTIGGLVYYTDGVWIWPNYLSYYLEFFDIEISEDFIENINSNNRLPSEIDLDEAIRFVKNNHFL